MIIVSAMSVRPRTSSTLTFTAFISSSALVTAACSGEARSSGGRRRLRVVMCLSGFSWGASSAGVGLVRKSIAPRLENDLPHLLGHEVARIAARDEQRAQLGRGDLQLRSGVHVDATGKPVVQLTDAAGAVVHHHLAEWSAGGCEPARTVRDDDVRKRQ